MSNPRIAILGAGPTGLEAALATAEHGHDFVLYEAADQVAGHVRDWGHVRLFTPWSMNASHRMRRTLAEAGRPLPPDDVCPTGHELAEHLLEPLAETPALRGHLRLGTRVLAIGRQGLLKHEEIGSTARAGRPFRLLVRGADGRERIDSADIVLDCTGNTQPNTLGDAGIPAPGEQHLTDRIVRRVPDFDRDADAYRGGTTLLIGAGHSGQTALRGLVDLAQDGATRLVWLLRGDAPGAGADDDPLPERQALDNFGADVAAHPPAGVDVRTRAVVETLEETADGRIRVTLRVGAADTTDTLTVDRIVALTGRVGDHLLYRQLQVHECYATSGPMKLAAALLSSSGGGGDCLQQTSLGPETLKSPEPGFFILGSKSYGRRTDFLLRVGWQQVDEVFQLLD
ncbi:MAG: NAD(P)-binding protein [Acidobacteriota bacterium]